jgi:hypothetical protein
MPAFDTPRGAVGPVRPRPATLPSGLGFARRAQAASSADGAGTSGTWNTWRR